MIGIEGLKYNPSEVSREQVSDFLSAGKVSVKRVGFDNAPEHQIVLYGIQTAPLVVELQKRTKTNEGEVTEELAIADHILRRFGALTEVVPTGLARDVFVRNFDRTIRDVDVLIEDSQAALAQ